jgi:hypothetical protein
MCSGFALAVVDEVTALGLQIDETRQLDNTGRSLVMVRTGDTSSIIDSSFFQTVSIPVGFAGSATLKKNTNSLDWATIPPSPTGTHQLSSLKNMAR